MENPGRNASSDALHSVGWDLATARESSMAVLEEPTGRRAPSSRQGMSGHTGSVEDLEANVTQYHASGDANDQFVESEFYEIQETIRLEKENSKNGWQVFLKTPGNRKRLLLIALTSFFSQCSGNGLVSYYLHDILNSVGITTSYDQSVINGGLQIWSFLVAIGFSAFLVDKLGRRMLFMIAGVGMLISFSIWTG